MDTGVVTYCLHFLDVDQMNHEWVLGEGLDWMEGASARRASLPVVRMGRAETWVGVFITYHSRIEHRLEVPEVVLMGGGGCESQG